jgi:hypothetical protein
MNQGETESQHHSTEGEQPPPTIPLVAFHHPSKRYRKGAVLGAIVVAVGSFFGSMVGEGELNYDLLTFGSFGCCSLISLAFVMEAVYNYKWIQYNQTHGLEEKNLKLNFVAACLLAVFGLVILFGNLLSTY